MLWEVVLVAALVLDIAAVVDIVGGNGDGVNKVVWIAIVLAFPVAGVILYFAFGKRYVGA
jgi:hypothetical protein